MTTLAFLAGVGTSLAVLNKIDPTSTERLKSEVRDGATRTWDAARERIEPTVQNLAGQARSLVRDTGAETRFGSTASQLAQDPRVVGAAGALLVMYAFKRLGLVGLVAAGAGVALGARALQQRSGLTADDDLGLSAGESSRSPSETHA